MVDKNLSDELENLESLKEKKFRIFGIKVSFVSVTTLLAIIGSIVGALYGGFLMYQKVEEVAGLDVGAFEQRMDVIETKLEEAVDYTRDIKNDLKNDIIRIEKQSDKPEDIVKDTEDDVNARLRQIEKDVFDMIETAEGRFETKRDALQGDYEQKADRLLKDYDEKADRLNTNVESDMDKLELDIKQEMKELEDRLEDRIQKSLDNPLAN